jgi:hypothetical protein
MNSWKGNEYHTLIVRSHMPYQSTFYQMVNDQKQRLLTLLNERVYRIHIAVRQLEQTAN